MTRARSLSQLANENVFTVDGGNNRIGIGSATPDAKLDIQGNIEVAGIITAAAGFAVTYFGDGSGLTGVASTDNIVTGTPATFNNQVTIQNLYVGAATTIQGTLSYEDVTNVDSLGIITARSHVSIADSILHTGDTDTAIRFPAADTFTVETGGTERLRVGSAGSVSIGPIDSSSIATLSAAGANTDLRLRAVGTGGWFEIETNSASRLRVSSAGDVGIGTDNAGSRLDVRNASGTDPLLSLHHSDADVEGEVIRVGRTDLPTIRYHSIKARHGGGASSNHIAFNLHDTNSVTSQSEVLRLRGDGRIGVGTVGPTHLLHVYDTTDNSAQRNDVQAYTGGITIQNQSEVFDAFAALRFNFHGDDSYYLKARRIDNNNGEFEIGQNYSSTNTDNIAIKIDNDLKVGIGSTVPARKLDVDGSARFIETIEAFDTSGGSRDWFLSSASFGFHDGNGVGFDAGGGLFRLAISGTERVRVNSNGDVNITGVGTAIQWDATSDITLKENIEVINEPIVKLSQLKGVTFDWKFGGHSVGVIAQDVEKVLPTAVGGSKDQKTVNYNAIIGLLVESVKDQQKQIEELKSLLDK